MIIFIPKDSDVDIKEAGNQVGLLLPANREGDGTVMYLTITDLLDESVDRKATLVDTGGAILEIPSQCRLHNASIDSAMVVNIFVNRSGSQETIKGTETVTSKQPPTAAPVPVPVPATI